MTDEDTRIAVLESQQKTHTEASLANQEEIKKTLEKLFCLLEETKNRQFEICNNQTRHDGKIESLEKRLSHVEGHLNNPDGILDWINRTKGSLMTLRVIYPIVQGLLIFFVKFLI